MGIALPLLKKARNSVNIDHHVSNTNFAQINYVDSQASSTCEIVFRILNKLDSPHAFDPNIASALYAGIIYDTGGLRHNSTSLATMEAARRLMAFDIPFTQIYNDLMHMRTFIETKAMGRAIQNLYLVENENGSIACTYITCEDLNETGATIADLGDICEYVVNITGVQVALFIYQRLDHKGCKISMRSKNTPINGIAERLGGGGHSLAAGCDFAGTLEQAQETVIGMLKELLWTE
jgi:phosphoesterase RecJ-like protein